MNFDNNERTERIYFNVEITNQSNVNIQAKADIVLQKPLFRVPQMYDLCINRFRLPLNGIPLTRDNIPFQQWQVSLGYYANNQWNYQNTFVPQYNPAYKTIYTPTAYALSHGSNGAGEYLSVNPDLTTSQVYNSQNFSDFNSNILPTFDLYNNSGTYYYVSQDQSNVYCVYMKTGETYTINVPSQNVFTSIYADVNTNELYLSVYNQTGNTTASGVYARTNDSTWTQTGYYLASTSPITSVSTTSDNVFLNCGSDKVMYKYQKGNAYSTSSFTFQYPGSQHITYNNLIYHFETFIYGPLENNLISVFDTSFNDIQNFQINNGASYIGLDNMNNILLSFNGGTQNQAIDGNGNLQYEFTSAQNFTFVFYGVPNSTQVPIDSGEYSIWSYQDYLTQINTAFKTCYANMLTAFPSYEPTNIPQIYFEPTTRLFYMTSDALYSDPTTYLIDLNQILYNMFLFPSLPDNNQIGYKSILVNPTSQTGSTNKIYQESSSLAKFYDLVRILVQTVRLPVNGDNEGSNQSQLVITDVVPDTSSLSPSGLLIYQPTVLRFYSLYSTTPLNNIDLYFSYGTKKGNIYPVYIAPNEYASCKLQFSSNPLNNN